jgi:hypothetical protein
MGRKRHEPYIRAEWNFGGFPPYLREAPGITIRTLNKPSTERVQNWFERLSQMIKPRLASVSVPRHANPGGERYANVSKRYFEAGQGCSSAWLCASNEIVILEEQMGSPVDVRLQVEV